MVGLVTLLTDFGTQDVYVGVMKGVIAQIAPQVRLVDLTHEIPAQNIALACFQLANAYVHFPSGTVHLAVVDPGVGGERRAVAIQIQTGFLVGPDNGLLSGVLAQSPALAAVELTNPDYWYRRYPSTTFHGRDIFAAIAAHLAAGVSLHKLGSELDPSTLVTLSQGNCETTATGFRGVIQAVDHFGNLISTIPGHLLTKGCWWVEMANQRIPSALTYGDRRPGAMMALVGSHGWIEVAVNGGNAQVSLDCHPGDPIQVVIQ